MKIWVKPFGALKNFSESSILKIELKDRSTIGDLIDELESKHKGFKELALKSSVTISINGFEINFLKQFETKLSEGDTVAFLPLYAGG